MKKINLAITGCMGRMGRQIITSARSDKGFKIVAITESKKLNKKIHNLRISQNSLETFKKANVIIDFSIPKYIMLIYHKVIKTKLLVFGFLIDLMKF